MTAELLQLAAIPVTAGIFINGVEELLIDVQYFVRGLHRRERRAVTMEELAAAPRRRIAIMVAAWHEADVIESMLEHNRRNLDYDPALFDIFCGTYQNDPDTQQRVTAVAQRYTNVHKVVVPHDGPTSKADCLNWVYQGIVLEEKRRGERFDILLMHDAEDLIHPLALRLYSLLIPAYDFVQTPVFSLPLAHKDVVASTYIDEFAEHHLKDMLVREAIGGLVPSAGVGSAFAREAFEEIALANDQHPFNVDSLTEDYEVGLKFRLAGKRVHFALRSLQRTRTVVSWLGRTRQIVEEEYIATREYFPNQLRSSVRQRARWITGIALQTWRQIGWRGPAAVRYCLWRDRKVVATNSLLLGAYGLVATMGVYSAVSSPQLETFVPTGSALWWLMGFNLFVLAWRAAMKMNFVGRLYGVGHALASAPRLIVANIIGLAATARAVRQFLYHVWTGTPLRWAKTAHEFPSFEVLAAQQRRLGEFLVEHGQLAAADVEDALRLQAGTELPLGEVIAGSGMMSRRAVVEALGTNLSIPYSEPIADDVPLALMRRLPEQVAVALEAMPVAFADDGTPVVAMAHPPRPDETQRLADLLGRPVRVVLAERDAIRRGRWRAYRRLVEGAQPDHDRLGEALLESGELDLDRLDRALDEQLDTGERLGELLVRHGWTTTRAVAAALWPPRRAYRSVSLEDVDIAALRRVRYGFASFYQLVPLRSAGVVALACPAPLHPLVLDEAAQRIGRVVEPVFAPGLEVSVALALASRSAWPQGVAMRVPGLLGAEIAELTAEPALATEAFAIARAAKELGTSPIGHLVANGRIDQYTARELRARALGLSLVHPHDCTHADDVLPPELVDEHDIRLCAADAHGLVLAAPYPTPGLARRVAELFVHRAVAWRALAYPGQPARRPLSVISPVLEEAI